MMLGTEGTDSILAHTCSSIVRMRLDSLVWSDAGLNNLT